MSVSINYVITSVTAAGPVGVSIAFTFTESTTGLSENHVNLFVASVLNVGVTSMMSQSAATAQQLANFVTLITPLINAFATTVKNVIIQNALTADLNIATGTVSVASVPEVAAQSLVHQSGTIIV